MQKNKNYQDQRSVNIFGKGTDSNYVRVWAQAIPIATTRSCHCSQKAAINNMRLRENSCFPIMLYLPKQLLVLLVIVYQLLTRIMLKKKGKVAGFKLQGIKTKLQYGDSLVMTQNKLMK